jgi:starch synthase
MLSTVSPTYAREIQTSEYGFGLDGVLRERGADLRGILNGIDVAEWNPATDPHLAARYDATDLAGKAVCKAALQQEAGLPVRTEVPVFGLVGRLVAQKGVDVLAQTLERVLEWDLQVVLLGTGEPDAERYFAWLSGRRPDRFKAWIGFDDARAHRIEAGADFFLMPSRFEPCGLNQMYSLRYGTPPVVRATGGLADTVVNYSDTTLSAGTANGFVFHEASAGAFLRAVRRALSVWRDRAVWQRLQRNGMGADFGWPAAARAYLRLYKELA